MASEPATPTALPLPSTSQPSPSNASISVRDYIYFLPDPLPAGTPVPYTPGLPTRNPLNYPTQPFEPTSTLVLTSPGRIFVDVRVLKAVSKEEENEGLPNDGGHVERLEWAFAGLSESVQVEDEFTPETGGSYPTPGERTWAAPLTHATWTHWLDSKHPVHTPPSQIPADEATMYPLSATQTLEHGCATDPATGRSQRYEELWTDLPIAPTAPSPFKTCVVLVLDASELGRRGVVIRLGEWCQGVLVCGDSVTVERWEFKAWGEEGEGEWVRRVRIGDGLVPCAVACKKVVGVGGVVRYFDHEWVVREAVEWRDADEGAGSVSSVSGWTE